MWLNLPEDPSLCHNIILLVTDFTFLLNHGVMTKLLLWERYLAKGKKIYWCRGRDLYSLNA